MKKILLSLSVLFLLILLTNLVFGNSDRLFPVRAQGNTGQLIADADFDIHDYLNGQPSSLNKKQNNKYVPPMKNLYSTVVKGTSYSMMPVMTDANGDGLLDLMFSYTEKDGCASGDKETRVRYTLLNTGTGYSIAYACKRTPSYQGGGWECPSSSPIRYRGTCADI
jgi:hypothetical protein